MAAKPKTEKFPVHNRWTNAVQFTASIVVTPDMSYGVKLGLAVQWGVENDANLSGANLSGANLSDANLRGANLSDANLSDANLRGAYLSGANLRGAYLSGANLSDANLSGANLRGANLRGANLNGAYLSDANLRGANLRDAYLSGAKIKRAFASLPRSDGYNFLGVETEAGELMISAGCRWLSPEQYRAHIASEYPDTDKAKETLRIIEFIEGRADDLGYAPAKIEQAA
ncbi:MAG: pentapeptide repeat-containing protein [Parcubacteria group bacterium]